jgi:signal transduction histidine kinase/ActR/RegA family two-component response regulator
MTRWVVLPLRRISGSLAAEELAPIRGLLSHRTEFGHIAQLIQQFFQQKSELVQEIEERKRAEKEKEHLQSQLERTQRLQTIGTLAGGVAHNFNNLLTPIVGYADMVLRQIEQDDSMRPNIEQIAQAGSRAKDLVREILTFSRSGEQERSLSQLHLLFKEALKLVHASVPPNVEIRENLDESCGAVFCDASQMHQVLMNLCTNAFHAMREKGGILEVTLDSLEVGHDLSWLRLNLNPGYYVRLTVSDTGCGMDRATMERIFEPFFTTKDAGEGVGLGLSVLHGIVLAHGGAVTVYSEPGKGTTFRIYLPAQRQGTQKASPEARPVPAGGESVLFVDDEPIIVNMGKQMLEKLGYRVTAVTSGEEALRLFRDKPGEFDILITDQTMPCITGDRLAKEVLNLRPDLPIVMITGFSQCVTTVNYRELGIREYVMKPLLMRELSEAIRRAVELQPEAVN